jgi:hypothetical protein
MQLVRAIPFLWRSTRGYRLRPWASPYLRWRVETYWGLHAEKMDRPVFLRFVREHAGELIRFTRWAGRMRRR